MAALSSFIGALLPTFILSRIFLWLTRKWHGGLKRIGVAHFLALAACTLISGFGLAGYGETFVGAEAVATYALPQLAWFAFDCYLHSRRKKPIPLDG